MAGVAVKRALPLIQKASDVRGRWRPGLVPSSLAPQRDSSAARM